MVPNYPTRLDPVDQLTIQLHSALEALSREQLKNLELQRQNTGLMQALLDERERRLTAGHTEAEQRLHDGVALLESKYGVRSEDQIDWKTGFIRPPATKQEEAAPSSGAAPQQAQATDPEASAGAGGVPAADQGAAPIGTHDGTDPPDPPGAGAGVAGGAGGAGPAVDGVPEE